MYRPSSQKRRPAILATSVAVLFSLGFLLSPQKAAADQYWDGTATPSGSGTANGAGGTGTWDSSTANWVDSAGTNPVVYDPIQTSIFATMGGTVTLGNDLTFSTLRFDTTGYTVDPGSGPFKLSAPSGTGTIKVTQAGDSVTINAQLSGTGAMDFEGGGTIRVTNASNDYSGGTFIGSGGSSPTVIISSDSQLGAAGSAIIFGGGTLNTTASIATSRPVQLLQFGSGTLSPDISTTLTMNGAISGAGTLVVGGLGTVILGNSSNSYTGGTTINGTLSISSDGNLGGSGSNLTFNGGTLLGTATVTTFRSVTVNSGGATFTPVNAGTFLDFAGQISGSGSLTVNGNGIVEMDATNNNYTGPTSVLSGTLSAGATNAVSGASALTLGPGTVFALNGFNQSVASLNGSGTVSTSGGTLTAGSNGAPVTFTGVIEGAGGFTKVGTGTTILTGTNTYTGRTTVNGGKLIIDPTGVISSSSTLVMGGGAYQQNGDSGQTFNGLVVNAGSNQIILNNLGSSTTLDLRGTGAATAGITHNGGTIDFSSVTGPLDSSTVIRTHQANDATGMIGAWATVNGGSDFASNHRQPATTPLFIVQHPKLFLFRSPLSTWVNCASRERSSSTRD